MPEKEFIIFVKGTNHERDYSILGDNEAGAVEMAIQIFNEDFPDDTALETDIYSEGLV